MSALPAAVTAVGGALMFGISDIAGQRSTKRVARRKALSPRILCHGRVFPYAGPAASIGVVFVFVLVVVAVSAGAAG